MNLNSVSAVQATGAASPVAEQAQILMMRKAMDMQAVQASQMLQALPQPASVAASGALGNLLNTYA